MQYLTMLLRFAKGNRIHRPLTRNTANALYRIGTSVDYTQRIERDEILREEATKVVQAAKDCSISLVTTMRSNSAGRTRHFTNIWVMSDDKKVRLQQRCKCTSL